METSSELLIVRFVKIVGQFLREQGHFDDAWFPKTNLNKLNEKFPSF